MPAQQPPPGSLGYPTIKATGRVVSVESCFDALGCAGVADLTVSMLDREDVQSNVTNTSGGYELSGVPASVWIDLVAAQGGAARDFVPTLNARAVPPREEDVHEIDLYVLPRDVDSVLAAWTVETRADLARAGGLVVLVVGPDPDNPALQTALDGVRVVVYPAPSSGRYVNVVPRYRGSTGEEMAFLAADADATGPFGLYVAAFDAPHVQVGVTATAAHFSFPLATTEIRPGLVSFVLLRGQ